MKDNYELSGEGLVEQLFTLLEKLDKISELLSSAESEFKRLEKIEKHILAVLQSSTGAKSEAQRSRLAYSNEGYMKWFWKWDISKKEYLKLRAKKEALGIRIDTTRSALSFFKVMVDLAK